MKIKNLPIVLAGLIVIISILLVVVGDGTLFHTGEYNYANDKIIARSP